jgi:hypothetical protein
MGLADVDDDEGHGKKSRGLPRRACMELSRDTNQSASGPSAARITRQEPRFVSAQAQASALSRIGNSF